MAERMGRDGMVGVIVGSNISVGTGVDVDVRVGCAVSVGSIADSVRVAALVLLCVGIGDGMAVPSSGLQPATQNNITRNKINLDSVI